MKILAFAVLLAVMQASPPIPRETTDKAAQTAANIQSKSASNQTPPLPAPSPVKTGGNGPTKADSSEPRPEDQKHDIGISKLPPVTINPPKRDLADWSYLAFSGLLVIVGGLQVWLLHGTLGAIRRQADLMERQINKERAHIRIELKPLQLTQPDPGEGETVQVINYTVSFYGFAYAFIDADAFEVELSDSTDAGDGQVKTSLGWNSSNVSTVLPPGTSPDARFEAIATTQFEIDSLMHGKSFIHFRGHIKYHDFANQHETTICRVWKSWGPRKGKPPSILGGSGHWDEAGPPEANHET